MIDDLDRAIEELLRTNFPERLSGQVMVSFATPDQQFPPQSVILPAVDLFLYDVRENTELRSNEWVESIDRQSGTAVRKPPPKRIDCSYLVTSWVSEGSPTRALDEHRLLSEVMAILLRHPVLPAEVLRGRLAGQELPPPAAALRPGRLQSVGEFWQALGGKPKAAFDYTVTICLETADYRERSIVTKRYIELEEIPTAKRNR